MIVKTGLGTNSGLISTGITTAGGILAAAIPAVAAVPLIGPAIAGVALLVGALGIGNGCGGTCTEATQVANAASTALAQNLAAAQQTVAENGCLTEAEQQQCIVNIQTIYNNLVAGCKQIPAPGGTQCVTDRQPGGRFDIQGENIPLIQALPVCSAALVGGVSLGSISPLLLIGGGALLLGLFMGGD